MKISYNWLKNYIDLDLDPETTADKLTLIGLEVEEMEKTGISPEGLVVGKVLTVNDHPSADRLKLCSVDLGDDRLQIVCGADNVAPNQKVAVATTGSFLPVAQADGSRLEIKKVKLRGEISEGMICSESELGLSDDHKGIMVLDDQIPAGTSLCEALDLQEDTIYEIGLTPNRPDASSHIGVARDLAAVIKKSVNHPYKDEPGVKNRLEEWIDITIDDQEQCHRYVGKIVKDITISESPGWLKNRLRSIGLRPVNNVVDATNYILHECGQPLHAFDYNLLEENRIVVKSFDEDRTFRTLDGADREVPAGALFICDGRQPVAIAGVMGGLNSEVTKDSHTILIESAYFSPSSIRRTSKYLGLQTDSSYRFERGVDPNLAGRACERAAELIAELAGGTIVDGTADVHPVKTSPLSVNLRARRLNQLLGTDLDMKFIISTLNALEIKTPDSDEKSVKCVIPTFRPDITREVDLIEEVGRIFDYNNIPKPESAPFIRPAPIGNWEKMMNRARTAAARLKYKEITSNSLLSEKDESWFSRPYHQIQTLNPVSLEATTLRTTLLAGFMKALQYNLNRDAVSLRFFEAGHTYRRSENGTWIDGIEEHSKLLFGICGYRHTENWRHQPEHFTIFDLKADVESFFAQMGAGADIETEMADPQKLDYLIEGRKIGSIQHIPKNISRRFDIGLPAFAAEIDLTLLYGSGRPGTENIYSKVTRYPSFEYDAAYIVDQHIPAGKLSRLIRSSAGPLLKNLEVFDVYTGGNLGSGKKSIAFRLTFLDSNKTLNINDVEPTVQNITQVLESELKAVLRS